MDKQELKRVLSDLEARKELYERLQASVGGKVSWEHTVAVIEEEIRTKTKTTVRKITIFGSPDSETTDSSSVVPALQSTQRPIRKGLVVLGLSGVALFWLGSQYLAGLLSETNEEYLKDESGSVQLVLVSPQYISKGKRFHIHCQARRTTSAPCKTRIVFEPKSAHFQIERGVWYKDLDLTKAARQDWKPYLTYDPNDSLLESIRYLVQRRHIDVNLGEGRRDGSPQACLSFKIHAASAWALSAGSCVLGILLALLAALKAGLVNTILGWLARCARHRR